MGHQLSLSLQLYLLLLSTLSVHSKKNSLFKHRRRPGAQAAEQDPLQSGKLTAPGSHPIDTVGEDQTMAANSHVLSSRWAVAVAQQDQEHFILFFFLYTSSSSSRLTAHVKQHCRALRSSIAELLI